MAVKSEAPVPPPETEAAPTEGEACSLSLVSALKDRTQLQSIALMGLFLLATLYTLYLAKPFLLPIVLSILFTMLLRPVVRGMARAGIPEPVGAAIVVLALLALVVGGIYGLSGPASTWIHDLPSMASRIEAKIRPVVRPVQQVTEATARVEEKIQGAQETPEVEIKQPGFSDTLLTSVGSFGGFIVGVVILLYFLLASGDMFLRKLVKVLPNFQEKKRAVEIAQEVQSSVSVYLGTTSLIYAGLGAATALAMFLLGMPNPILWGVVAALLNFIPYVGGLATLMILTAVALLSFDNLGYALLIPAVFFVLNTIEGYLVTPMILGRRLTLNPVVIFIGMTFWWWVWGIPGALLAVPMLAVLKIVCDHIESLNPLAEFLGD